MADAAVCGVALFRGRVFWLLCMVGSGEPTYVVRADEVPVGDAMYRTILAVLMPLVFSVSSRAATFDVRDHGAIGDGQAFDTQAIQATLDTCAAAGDLVSGPLNP